MDFEDTPQEAAYREQVRAWLADHAPAHELTGLGTLSDADTVARGRAWQKTLVDGGYAGILLPKALGGSGGTLGEALIFSEEESRYSLPKGPYVGIGLGMALPVIGKHGTPEQIAKFAAPTLRGELTWCQLFSEPSAGSDLANLRTKAVRDGDDWIVNGQKVWSSWAHLSDWGILIVRTDPKVVKHKGLTFFVVDMKTPGIDIRPIRQISGASDFNETFFTDVRIPDANRIGAVGEGWACAITVLMGERLNAGGHDGPVRDLIAYAAATPTPEGNALASSYNRLTLAQAYAEERALDQFQDRLRTQVSRGENPGAYASIGKLAFASRYQRLAGFAMELREAAGIAHEPGDEATATIWHDYIWSTALRIAGGADEVLRNQIAERILGLPGEIRADKDVPFDKL
jgi:acyl-CoA dehydrogenase